MRKSAATSVDVARLAGVSQSTVSRVFGPDAELRVSVDLGDKVMRAAAELGYRPNAMARSLITRRSRMVAVLFSYLDNPFYAMALEQICHALQLQGYHALVFMLPNTLEDNDPTVAQFLEYQVDGVVTASVELSSEICAMCRAQGVPIVMFNRLQDDPDLSGVATDNVNGGRLAAQHLIQTGATKIGMIGGWKGASTNRDREFGFRAELGAHGRALFAYGEGKFDLPSTALAVRQMFARVDERPDAVFFTNDYMAISGIEILKYELGLNIPLDVAVVGFDDIPAASRPGYALTTVRQNIPAMVEATLRILFDRIEGRVSEPEHVLLGARLIRRQSTARSAG